MIQQATKGAKTRPERTPATVEQAQFSDTYTMRDYEVMLDLLYGLFKKEDAATIRVFDPFVSDMRRAPLITPQMLTERIESLLVENANA